MRRRRKRVWWKWTPGYIGGAIGSLGAIGAAIVWIATFITLPEAVAANTKAIDTIAELLKEQKTTNEILKEKQKKILLSPNGKKYWNEQLQQWRPIKELNQ